MKMLKIPAISCLLVALTILVATPVSGQIILKQSNDPYDKLTRCWNWWECYKQELIAKETSSRLAPAEAEPIPITPVDGQVAMPNLIAMDVDGKIRSAGVGVKAEVVNDGTRDAGAFDFSGNVTFVKVDNGQTYGPYPVSKRIQSLAVGPGWDDYLGWVSPPDRDYAYDVHITVTADSRNFQNGGEVRESSEADNMLMVTCRMAGTLSGQNIAGSVPPCQ